MNAFHEFADKVDHFMRAACTPIRLLVKPWDALQTKYQLYGVHWFWHFLQLIVWCLIGLKYTLLSPFLLLKAIDDELREHGLSLQKILAGIGVAIAIVFIFVFRVLTMDYDNSQ